MRREGVNVNRRSMVDMERSPDTLAVISADVRVFWPPQCSPQEVAIVMYEAYQEAYALMMGKMEINHRG